MTNGVGSRWDMLELVVTHYCEPDFVARRWLLGFATRCWFGLSVQILQFGVDPPFGS